MLKKTIVALMTTVYTLNENKCKAEAIYSNTLLKALSHLDVLASVWQGIKMYAKRWRTLNY